MAKKMSDADWREFVGHGTRTGKLATVGQDGAPHVVPVWFVLDGDDIVFTTGTTSVKARNLRADDRAALCVDEEVMPYAFVQLRGRVTMAPCPADMLDQTTRLARRYVGDDRAAAYGTRNAVPDELLVRLRVEHAIGYTEIAG
jgi:hypothetical protein